MARSSEHIIDLIPSTLSPIDPLRLPVFPYKKRLKRRVTPPERFDLDRQRRRYIPTEFPKIIPFRKNKYGRIIMGKEAA